jgi:hypothetical protein
MKLLSRKYLLCVVQGPVRFFVAKRETEARAKFLWVIS